MPFLVCLPHWTVSSLTVEIVEVRHCVHNAQWYWYLFIDYMNKLVHQGK